MMFSQPGLPSEHDLALFGPYLNGQGKSGLRKFLNASRRRGATLFLFLAVFLGGVFPGILYSWEISSTNTLSSSGYSLGPFTPGHSIYSLSNTGEVQITWTSLKDGNWFSVEPFSGVLDPGDSTNLIVFINSAALEFSLGNYQGTLTVSNQIEEGVFHLPVELSIGVPGPGMVDALLVESTNQIQLEVTGLPGTTVIVEASTNFLNWEGIATNTLESKRISFAVGLEGFPSRYYRSYSDDGDAVPGRLTLSEVLVEDSLQVLLSGDPGGIYLVESSTNGLDWTSISTNKLPEDGMVVFTNSVTGDETNLIYRAQILEEFMGPPVHQVLIIGQSLGLGVGGAPALSVVSDPHHFRYFSDGMFSVLNPLKEISLESMASGLAKHVSAFHPDHRLLFSNVSEGGAEYERLKKGTESYTKGINQFRYGPQDLAMELLSLQPSALFAVHGEGDHINPNYGENIRQWQEDYQADIHNVTGSDSIIPMFHSQASAWTSPLNGSNGVTLGAYLVLEESKLNPDRTILVGPKYPFTYIDGIHLTNSSYRWLGEYYGKAYRKTLVEGIPWVPLNPAGITREGTNVTAIFEVPVPPLVLDTNLVLDPGDFGFEYHDDSGNPPAILSVELSGSDTVVVVLDREPTGRDERLRYAYSGIPGNPGGPVTGPRGNLRDSDQEASLYGNPLYNWCVHFDEPVVPLPPE